MTFLRTLPRLAPCMILGALAVWLLCGSTVLAGEAQLAIPNLHDGHFTIAGYEISAWNLLFYGALVITGTLSISLYLFHQIKTLPAHESMLDISEIIFQTCKTYLIQQGKFLLMLFALIGSAMTYYFMALQGEAARDRVARLAVLRRRHGRLLLRWPGTASASTPTPTARTAFASLRGEPWDVVNIPLRAGMSVGLFLISLELVMMVIILLFVPTARSSATASSASPSANRWAPRPCASPAASSPRSPTSAPT